MIREGEETPLPFYFQSKDIMKKKYGIRNASECVLRLPVGSGMIVCNFTNGNLQSREEIPASYTTDNPIIQHVIENCDRFKGGKIFLMAEYEEAPKAYDAPKAEPEKPKKAKKAEKKPRIVESVTTFGEAVTFLMTEDGVKMGDLKDEESCIRIAEEIGITFPNLK
jgi:hypothetical protein